MNNLIRRSTALREFNKFLKPHPVFILSSQGTHNERSESNNSKRVLLLSAIGATCVSLGVYKYMAGKNEVVHASKLNRRIPGDYRPELPSYSLDDVGTHDSQAKRIWVTYKEGVYDVTEFVEKHPGGKNILLGAGASVEPFWMIYGIHKTEKILDMLEEMRIGNISPEDAKAQTSNMEDPYSSDPRRHAILKPASMKPFNAEPNPPSLLVESFYTPNDIFYVRNHLPVPAIDPESYELEIEVEGSKKSFKLNLNDIKKLPKYSIDATIMCAGNRRSEMAKIKYVKGLSWGFAAIGNAKWTGPRLRDVLIAAGVKEDDPKFKHVHFHGTDVDPTYTPYDVSIPFHKAMDRYGDVILAYEMNGEPLPRDHGFPVRVIVPGTVGARNVKWLESIHVSEKESTGFWQASDYKGFSPSVDWDNVDFSKSPAIQELPVISAICMPETNETVNVEDGFVTVKGYAYSGGGKKIVRVDITGDNGKTWVVANIDHQNDIEPPRHYAWTLWSAKIPVNQKSKTMEIWVKAVDSSYNTQPESFQNIWNLRGVLSNAYHKVPIYLTHNGAKK